MSGKPRKNMSETLADCHSGSPGNLPPYSAIAMAQWMPPRKEAIEAPYPTCSRAALLARLGGRAATIFATGGDRAMKGIAPGPHPSVTCFNFALSFFFVCASTFLPQLQAPPLPPFPLAKPTLPRVCLRSKMGVFLPWDKRQRGRPMANRKGSQRKGRHGEGRELT